jgi:membrane protease YdiL (CAAX protease family)
VIAASVPAFGFLVAALWWLRKPWSNAETSMRRVIASVGCFYAALTFSLLAEQLAGMKTPGPGIGQMLTGLLSLQGAGLVLVMLFLREQHLNWTEAFGFRNSWLKAVLWGVIAICLFMPAGQTLQLLSVQVIKQFHIEPKEQIAVQTLRVTGSWLGRVVLGVGTVVLAPMAEETIFRGILYPGIKQAGFRKMALWVPSIVFGLMHTNLEAFLPLVVLALGLTILYEKTDNLLAPITAHALFNAYGVVTLYMRENQSIPY